MKSPLFILALGMSLVFPVTYSIADDSANGIALIAAPSALQKIDSKVGSGKEAVAGNTVAVHYSGWLFDEKAANQHGKAFDSSVGRGPFEFPLGAGRVIKGWDQGVAGMKVGGKRTLIIPAELGYGARGAGGVIPPNAKLIFDVELLDVK
ncbi:FKBP-type peptidyl-prolyl cis-trans isomerase [Undibacterium parvum]|uniref:Peptidyl-prolyl cis-trans isomerase n=1 Tax=Undibacterium parvum TaxID=401471 RepID=A0A3S9HJ41_9BURK|nr:FKBP-type peptidyl-prolyl cis-trans isomerase [Undibacterium parvum]AZP12135.1 FKBP-type peptidyl-prolyl cis-trans isomerase [Undibacterium parvum]